jgi:DNA-binding NtrC family response regulator
MNKNNSVLQGVIAKARILLAEDDEIMRITLHDHLRRFGWTVDEAEDGLQALEMIKQNSYQLILSDIRMPGLDGEKLLAEIKIVSPQSGIILMTAYGSTDDAINCLKKGASDYILKPFDLDDLTIRINRVLDMQSMKVKCQSLQECCARHHAIIGSSPPMHKLLTLIQQIAPSDSTVLISGETGTGKELVATAIHRESPRARNAYIRVNCAAIPQGLMESEFFGHEKGAFTGAVKRQIGKFELADNGTILLDEIGDMPLDLQAKLLRVLQEREIERIGGNRTIKIDARVICATSRDLLAEVRQGNFREDLFYRLQVIPLEIPPLRERMEDIPELCAYFLNEFSRKRGMAKRLSNEALAVLNSYKYPGNVRELKNIIERLSVLAPSSVIQPWELPADVTNNSQQNFTGSLRLSEVLAKTEKHCIITALRRTDGNKTKASRLLGISRKNLWEKLKTHQITMPAA